MRRFTYQDLWKERLLPCDEMYHALANKGEEILRDMRLGGIPQELILAKMGVVRAAQVMSSGGNVEEAEKHLMPEHRKIWEAFKKAKDMAE